MSIRRDLVIKISNGSATLDMPLQIYEKDHGIELRFKLMDYKYKYDKDPENILNSNKEDILEAYTTIVNPIGYELAQINGEVVDDTVRFMIEDSYTDELEELGTYQLQIHVKCTHSEFSIPPVRFEVLERLKGEKVVTDGDDEVDYSDIIDGSTKFIDDETGKLIIQWQKGDTISSVRLNAMVEVINNAVDEEAQRQLNEVEREQQELEREQQEIERENRLQAALNSVDARVDESMNEYETRFNALTASQQQDMEVIDARDNEVSLKARLDRDVSNPLQVYEDVEDSYISCDSTVGYAQNVEILGNTIQDEDNLADIRSVGDKVECQELYEIDVLSCGVNLFNINSEYEDNLYYYHSSGTIVKTDLRRAYTVPVKAGMSVKCINANDIHVCYFTKDGVYISGEVISNSKVIVIPAGTYFAKVSVRKDVGYEYDKLCVCESSFADDYYEPYQEDKLTILSPVQLEKVGDVADRIICKDGVWGVEKNVETIFLKDVKGTWAIAFDNENTISFRVENVRNVGTFYYICNKLPNKSQYNADEEGIWFDHNLIVTLNKNVEVDSVDKFKSWINSENVYVISTGNNNFIPLPHDQQVKLRTFAGKTNILFLTEIEGTIKASIPHSLGATINSHSEQIDNLNKELDKVKKLEESTVSTVVTESDFTTVTETVNGYFEDVKLEGRTLVNLYPELDANNYSSLSATLSDNIITINADGNWKNLILKKDVLLLKTSTYYTFVINIIDNTIEGDNPMMRFGETLLYDASSRFRDSYYIDIINKKGIYTFKLKTKDSFDDTVIDTRDYLDNTATSGTIVFKYMILEGDHTQNPPEYFEGLMSVGEDVEEVSVESVNENLFALNKYYLDSYPTLFVNTVLPNLPKGVYITRNDQYSMSVDSIVPIEDGLIINKPSGTYRGGAIYIKHLPNTTFNISYTIDSNVPMYQHSLGYNIKTLTTSSNGIASMVISQGGTSGVSTISNIFIGFDKKEYTPSQSNKKPLLYYNPTTQVWEKPILREWDSIEKHSDGKYYYHKRSGEVVLDDTRSISQVTIDSEEYLRYDISLIANSSAIVICDKFVYDRNTVKEKITHINNAALVIVINKSKLSTPDLAGFKAWLQANPTTVVYQLVTEEVYECINIDLITYKDETNYIVNAGAIDPKSTLKVMCNINNVVRELQQKVSNLENYIQHVMIDALNNALNE